MQLLLPDTGNSSVKKADTFLPPGAYKQTERKTVHDCESFVGDTVWEGLRDKDSILSPDIKYLLSPLIIMVMMVTTMIIMVVINNIH